MKISDVVLWEQLYYKTGSFGIYVSWSPYAEYYMIVYNLFSHIEQGVEIYCGPDACKNLQNKARLLGVELKDTNIWVDSRPSN